MASNQIKFSRNIPPSYLKGKCDIFINVNKLINRQLEHLLSPIIPYYSVPLISMDVYSLSARLGRYTVSSPKLCKVKI